jgi:prepilin-type N-terminal cleavage/methylation domain-containing protein
MNTVPRPNKTASIPMKKRCAYTLVEMLIVMVILAFLFGLAWPTLRSPWGQSKLEDAAEKVRATMANARRESITTVQPWQFCYRPGAADYVIGPLHLDDEDASVTESDESDLDLDAEETKPELTIEQLPYGVTFCDPEVDLELEVGLEEGGLTENDTTSEPVNAALSSELTSGEWSSPIVFFPNGRSTSDLLRLRSPGPEVRIITVRIRGIIGAADIGHPHRIRKATDSAIEPLAEPSVEEEVSP